MFSSPCFKYPERHQPLLMAVHGLFDKTLRVGTSQPMLSNHALPIQSATTVITNSSWGVEHCHTQRVHT